MQGLISELTRLYLLCGQQWHKQKIDPSGEPKYYAQGALTPAVLRKSLAGEQTAALNLVHSDGTVRTLVVDFDRASDWPKVQRLYTAIIEELGLPAPAVAISGRKGYGVWLSLSEPIPAAQARAFLRLLRATYLADIPESVLDLRPDTDIPTNAAAAVVKLPPCKHLATDKWAAFIPPSVGEMFAETPWLASAPEPDQQAALLTELVSIPPEAFLQALNTLQAKGGNTGGVSKRGLAKQFPFLEKLAEGTHPACIRALLRHGVPETLQYNQANLNLANYCHSRGLSQGQAEGLATAMAQQSGDHPTSKTTVAMKLQNFRSNRDPAPFACDFPRNIAVWRNLFGGCQNCPAHPDEPLKGQGLVRPPPLTRSHTLERLVAQELLAYSWHKGEPLPQIVLTWPKEALNVAGKDGGAYLCPLYALIAQAIGKGATSSAFFALVDRWLAENKLLDISSEVKQKAERLLNTIQALHPREEEGQAALSRAIELEKREQLLSLSSDALNQGPDISANAVAMQLRHASEETLKADAAAGPLWNHRRELFKAFSRINSGNVIPTPFPRLTGLLHGGFKGGRLYILIAPPKAGKTTAAAVCMDHAALAGFPVLYVGYEMSREQMTEYAIARRCAINSYKIETRHLKEEEAKRVAASLNAYLAKEGRTLEIWEAGLATSIADMAAWATRAKANTPGKTPFIVVDYLQLARTGIKDLDTHPSETKRVSEVAVACKDLARQTGAAVLALSSVTKEAERMARTEGELDVTAARDSLAIIHAADGVLTLQTAMVDVKEGKGDTAQITELDAWRFLAHDARQKKRDIEAVELERAIGKLDGVYPQKWNLGPDYGVRARISLVRHRGSTGEVAIYYRRGYHSMEEVSLPGLGAIEQDMAQSEMALEVFREYEAKLSETFLEDAQTFTTNAVSATDTTQKKVATAHEPPSGPTVNYRYITDREEARQSIGPLLGLVGLDLETTGLSPISAQARLLSLSADTGPALVIDLFAIGGLHQVKKELMGLAVVCHNATFDMGFLWHSGVEVAAECSMLAYHVLTGERAKLKDLAEKYAGLSLDKGPQISDWRSAELTDEQLRYAALDAVAVRVIFPKIKQELEALGSLNAYALVRDAQPAIVRMELAGMPFDKVQQEKLIADLTAERDTLSDALKTALKGLNPASGTQISDWLTEQLGGPDSEKYKAWPKTAGGQLKTGGEELQRGLVYLSDEAASVVRDKLLRFKDVAKKLSAFGENLADQINPASGRIHADFNLAGTITGRMSCSKPNLQQIPRDKAFRALFAAPAGRRFVIADYSQVELRVAAHIAGEAALLKAYKDGQDIHRLTAAMLLNKRPDQVTKDERQLAKAVNFGLLYGQGAKGLQSYAEGTYGVTISEAQARDYRAAWFKAYPAFREWHGKSGLAAKKALEVRTPAGRVRRWPSLDKFTEMQAYNTPVQGGAAEAMLAAMPPLMRRLQGLEAFPIAVVHDELIVECAESVAEKVAKALQDAMIEGMLSLFQDASTLDLVEAVVAQTWADK
jgi:DNA polymerase I